MGIFKFKNIRVLGVIGIVFCVVEAGLLGDTQFNLPAGTPGRQEIIGTEEPDLVAADRKVCEHVIVPYTTCDLFFPIDGSQPTLYDAWEWSGAGYVGQDNDEAVTDWWIRIFGGNVAVDLSHIGHPDVLPAPKMVLDKHWKPIHIIQAMHEYTNFERKFWSTFRVIASTPKGRVLLYRLLIEVRRIDDIGCGCCGPDVYLSEDLWLEKGIRNFYRSITIGYDATAYDEDDVRFQTNNGYKTVPIARVDDPKLIIEDLFRELRRWFCILRNPAEQEFGSFGLRFS